MGFRTSELGLGPELPARTADWLIRIDRLVRKVQADQQKDQTK